MKYLEFFELETLTRKMTDMVIGSQLINGRVEAYSTKKVSTEKKESVYLKTLANNSSEGVNDSEKNTTAVNLIQTLHASLYGYDFSSLMMNTDSFVLVSMMDVIKEVNGALVEFTMHDDGFLGSLWTNIDGVIDLSKCTIYKLTDDPFVDPDGGTLWSFHYFFCNREAKRIIYFTCHATNKFRNAMDSYDEYNTDDDNMDEEDYDEENFKVKLKR